MTRNKPRYVTATECRDALNLTTADTCYLIARNTDLLDPIRERVQRWMYKQINPPLIRPARIDGAWRALSPEPGSVNYAEEWERGPNGSPRALWMD